MSAVWDKLFGSAPMPANDSTRLLRISDADSLTAPIDAVVGYESDRKSGGQGSFVEPLPNSVVVGRTFDSIGRRNESLRAQLDAIEFAFRNIEAVRNRFHDVLQPIDVVLAEIERTKTDHREAERKLEVLSAMHDQLREQHAFVTVERDALTVKYDDVSVRARDFEKAARVAEASLTDTRAARAEAEAKAERLDRELEDSKRRLLVVSNQLPALRAEFNAKEKRLQDVEQIRTTLQDQHDLLNQENRSLRSRIEELVATTSKLNRQLSETEGRNIDASRRVSELEAALAQETIAHTKLRAAHFDEVEGLRISLSNLQEEFNAVTGRSEAAERLLSEARVELRDRNSTIRALEQQAMETSLAIQTKDRALSDSERELTSSRAQLLETETARASLLDRCNDLLKAGEDKDILLQRAEQKISALDARLIDVGKLAASERDIRDERINALREQLESESAARAFAEGALQSARQERAGWQKDPESERAAKDEDAGRDKVTRLRG